MNRIYMDGAPEGHQMLRDNVALEKGFSLYKPYSEKQAAAFIGRDISTLKRWRRAGLFKNKFPTKHGEDGVQYLGIYIADLIIWGTGKWPNEPDETTASNSGPTGSGSGTEALPGIAAGEERPALNASHSARRILRKQSNV